MAAILGVVAIETTRVHLILTSFEEVTTELSGLFGKSGGSGGGSDSGGALDLIFQ